LPDVPETLDADHSVLEQPPCDDRSTCDRCRAAGFNWLGKDRDLFDPPVVCGRHLPQWIDTTMIQKQHSEKPAGLTTASQPWSLFQVLAASETKHQLEIILPCVPIVPKEPHNTMETGISNLDLPDDTLESLHCSRNGPSKNLIQDQVPPGSPLRQERQGAYDTPPYLTLPHHANESGPWFPHVATVLGTPPQSPVSLKSKISTSSRAWSHPSWRFSYNTQMPSNPSECTRDSSSVVPMDFVCVV